MVGTGRHEPCADQLRALLGPKHVGAAHVQLVVGVDVAEEVPVLFPEILPQLVFGHFASLLGIGLLLICLVLGWLTYVGETSEADWVEGFVLVRVVRVELVGCPFSVPEDLQESNKLTLTIIKSK